MNRFSIICALIMAYFVDLNQSGYSVSLTSSTKTTIINQHKNARNAAWNGATKLPAAKPTVKPSYSATLTWDNSLASKAQAWANTCTFGHSSYGNGENIYWTSVTPSQSKATAATPAWLSELSYYTWSTIGSSWGCQSGKMCGHYTQAIWGNTKKIGCGMSNCASSKVLGKYSTMVVCQYYPPGNYRGQYPYTKAADLPFGEVNAEPVAATQPILGLNIIIFALIAMMLINITCLIATASKRCTANNNGVSYQSVHTKEIEV